MGHQGHGFGPLPWVIMQGKAGQAHGVQAACQALNARDAAPTFPAFLVCSSSLQGQAHPIRLWPGLSPRAPCKGAGSLGQAGQQVPRMGLCGAEQRRGWGVGSCQKLLWLRPTPAYEWHIERCQGPACAWGLQDREVTERQLPAPGSPSGLCVFSTEQGTEMRTKLPGMEAQGHKPTEDSLATIASSGIGVDATRKGVGRTGCTQSQLEREEGWRCGHSQPEEAASELRKRADGSGEMVGSGCCHPHRERAQRGCTRSAASPPDSKCLLIYILLPFIKLPLATQGHCVC